MLITELKFYKKFLYKHEILNIHKVVNSSDIIKFTNINYKLNIPLDSIRNKSKYQTLANLNLDKNRADILCLGRLIRSLGNTSM